ncbi:hypothetical protein AC249_AIPGENE27725 [Exaiptasia diaphana]|nr:hypothetical protein AC249_AIPGENE27725 [Exaiptasia diaphana]
MGQSGQNFCILLYIKEFSKVIINYREGLPPVLYLQMDNCGRENKNTAVLSFLGLLVQMEVFRKDIDQMFSCVSRRLNKNNATTLEELSEQIIHSYNSQPHVSFVEYMHDAKKWILDYTPGFIGHSEPHQYKFEKYQGRVHMRYRKWSTSKRWLPDLEAKEDPLYVFPDNIYPTGAPLPIPVDLTSPLETLSKDLPKYGALLSQEEKTWWENYLTSMRERQTAKNPEGEFLFNVLTKVKDKGIQGPQQRQVLTEKDVNVHEDLE